MNIVLYNLCCHCVSVMYGWMPFPSTALSQVCSLSLYKTRKELKKLKEQGYIVSDRYCNQTEDGNYLMNGYTITDKAKETEEYRKAWSEERQTCKKALGIDIGECPTASPNDNAHPPILIESTQFLTCTSPCNQTPPL